MLYKGRLSDSGYKSTVEKKRYEVKCQKEWHTKVLVNGL